MRTGSATGRTAGSASGAEIVRIAIVFNRESEKVINLFGMPNREKIGQATIKRIMDALRSRRHQVSSFEGDKDLVDKLEEYMPRVVKGERPGMVFNLSYGIQGQARYTHVPSILEMVGIPYVGSGPLAHSLALDKVVAKMLLRQHNLPTPDFEVMKGPDSSLPSLPFPLIVKPKNEAVSYGIKIVHDEEELRDAAGHIFEVFQQSVLVERYIEGREINVGLLGNDPPEVLPPAEILFGESGPAIYTFEDKTRKSGREIKVLCPAPIDEALTQRAQDLAVQAFSVIGCYDCARVDMRLDSAGNLYILEINSLPSLGEHGSYTAAAQEAGLDYSALVNRLVEVASARYFGTPHPPELEEKAKPQPEETLFSFLTARRDLLEKRVENLVKRPSRTLDPVGIRTVVGDLGARYEELGLKQVPSFSDGRFVWTYETAVGLAGGTLLLVHADVPIDPNLPHQHFRKGPELLVGEGVGASRAPLVMTEYVLRGLRHLRRLRTIKLGVLFYADEGLDCRYSADMIRQAAGCAQEVLVLRPGNLGDRIIVQRRGQRTYQLFAEGKPRRLGRGNRTPDLLNWLGTKINELAALTSPKERTAVAAVDIQTRAFPMLLPHEVRCTLLASFPSPNVAQNLEDRIRGILGKGGYRWSLELVSDRPPMNQRKTNEGLAQRLERVAEQWEIPLQQHSSVWPSVGGLVPPGIPVVCGVGPVAEQLHTPDEAVYRISLIQRTLLLAQFLLSTGGK